MPHRSCRPGRAARIPRSASRRPSRDAALRSAALALLSMCWLVTGAQAQDGEAVPVKSAYRLSGLGAAEAADAARADASTAGTPEFFFRLPSSFMFDSLTGVDPDALGTPADRAHATLRYTWLSNPTWAMKIGLSTTMEPDTAWQRLLLAANDKARVGSTPLMHLSGQHQFSDRWMLSLDAEGQHWSHGQSLDMDLRLDYHLTPSLALYGSYRLSDAFGDAYEGYGFPVSNSARFGVRLRF